MKKNLVIYFTKCFFTLKLTCFCLAILIISVLMLLPFHFSYAATINLHARIGLSTCPFVVDDSEFFTLDFNDFYYIKTTNGYRIFSIDQNNTTREVTFSASNTCTGTSKAIIYKIEYDTNNLPPGKLELNNTLTLKATKIGGNGEVNYYFPIDVVFSSKPTSVMHGNTIYSGCIEGDIKGIKGKDGGITFNDDTQFNTEEVKIKPLYNSMSCASGAFGSSDKNDSELKVGDISNASFTLKFFPAKIIPLSYFNNENPDDGTKFSGTLTITTSYY